LNGYLLDTNIISDLIRNPSGSAARHIEKIGGKNVYTSIIVAADLRYGCARKASPRPLAKVEGVLEIIPVLPPDVPADSEYGAARTELEAAGLPIGANDLLIAAHACALELTLVTGNLREFSRIPGLTLENWL